MSGRAFARVFAPDAWAADYLRKTIVKFLEPFRVVSPGCKAPNRRILTFAIPFRLKDNPNTKPWNFLIFAPTIDMFS